MKISKQFTIEQIGEDWPDKAKWKSSPGFIPGRHDLLVLHYKVGSVDWAIGVLFHSDRCAAIALKYLAKHGLTPRRYHNLSDVERQRVKRELIENLAW